MSNRTLLDIELAQLYFDLLVDLAKLQPGKTIQYGELLQSAKDHYPNNSFLKRAIVTSMGRRLDFLREFTTQKKLPDLSSLVVNKSTGDNGEGFKKSFDGEVVRKKVSDFDWSEVKLDFDSYIFGEKIALEQRIKNSHKIRKIRESEARVIWWEFCKENRKEVSVVTYDEKEKIISLIMICQSPSDALISVRNISGANGVRQQNADVSN